MKPSSRNHCIDTIKGIGRFAVPYFFFVSGFYLPDKNGCITANSTRNKLLHILQLASKSAIFYSVFFIVWNLSMDATWNLVAAIRKEITLGSVIKFFLSCDPFVYAHFWYLLASITCYLVILVLGDRPGKWGYFTLFCILISLYSAFAEFHSYFGLKQSVSLDEGNVLVISNIFCFRALPFLLFGIFLKKQYCSRTTSIPICVLLIAIALGSVLSILEDKQYGTAVMYCGTHISVIALALISVLYPEKHISILEYIGNQLSMYIYIYHIAVGKCFDLLYTKLHLWGNPHAKSFRPLIVLIGTLATAQLILYCKSRIHHYRQHTA